MPACPQRHPGVAVVVSHHSPGLQVTPPHTIRAGASTAASAGGGGHWVVPQIHVPALQRQTLHPFVGGGPTQAASATTPASAGGPAWASAPIEAGASGVPGGASANVLA